VPGLKKKKPTIRVGLVEDDPMTLAQFKRMVDLSPELHLVFDCAGYDAAVDALSHETVDVFVTDINLPDGCGIDLISYCKHRYPAVEIIVISVLGDAKSVVSAIEAGATGYLLKDAYQVELVKAIKDIIAGGSPISATIARHILSRFQGTPEIKSEEKSVVNAFSKRESEVLSLIAMGYSYKDIAAKIGISPNTVPTYIKSIYRKLEVNSRGEAVFAAMRQGLINIRTETS